ncbi:hypothetical protein GOP47_0020541 [Adiantum capillus-veneris]|uniref:Chlorophyll a-b binding protein, chloroplastic n=1 Tax=Adiantum capillus-veneris TaxID=13818 RepID=A0A9D4UB96_ADICA|nr:hypothetical protein GOP47_0020541 [Adiantum capillus-veneris]
MVCSSSSLTAVAASSMSKSSFVSRRALQAPLTTATIVPSKRALIVSMIVANRPLRFLGSTPLEWLNESLPGDFGFDPLGLGSEPELLKWFVQSEIVDCRWAMLGATGIFITEALTKVGILNTPSWYSAREA